MAEVGIIMGSGSDASVMQGAEKVLRHFEISHEADIVSAHRTTRRMVEYASTAQERGLRVIIAGAGGAAHLPGMVAALTPLPVIGVPIQSRALQGMDSLLSIVQMPEGVPVATVAINGAANAGLLAVQILATANEELMVKLVADQARRKQEVDAEAERLRCHGITGYVLEQQ